MHHRAAPVRKRGPLALAIAGCLLATVGVAGCSSGRNSSSGSTAAHLIGSDQTIHLEYLQKQGDQQYFVDEAAGAKAEAAKLGNVDVTVVDLGSDANKAISEMDTAVAQKVDGIAIVVPDQQIGPAVIDKARAAGIPLIASDDVIKDETGQEAAFVGFDGTLMGQKIGEEAGKLYTAAGWTAANTRIIAAWKQDLSVCRDRVDGAKQAFTAATGQNLQTVEIGTDNTPTDAEDKAGAALTANPGVKHWVVWGCNDENETGVVTALQNDGVLATNIIGVGIGAYLDCKDWKAGQVTGNKAALYIDGNDVGASAIDSLVATIRHGVPLPPKTIARSTIVDATTWRAAGVACT
jgi:L-arabinose transport system substrate-binding protein